MDDLSIVLITVENSFQSLCFYIILLTHSSTKVLPLFVSCLLEYWWLNQSDFISLIVFHTLSLNKPTCITNFILWHHNPRSHYLLECALDHDIYHMCQTQGLQATSCKARRWSADNTHTTNPIMRIHYTCAPSITSDQWSICWCIQA